MTKINYDPAKRSRTLQEHLLDFENAPLIFDEMHYNQEDTRKDYGEKCILL